MLPFLPEGGPAIVNVVTGKLRLSERYWNKLPHEIKKFIIYHELGHLNAGRDEVVADTWALKHWIQHGHGPTKALEAQWDVFSFKSDEHIQRLRALFETAKHFDFHYNGNTRIEL
jgi:hypothetical protein